MKFTSKLMKKVHEIARKMEGHFYCRLSLAFREIIKEGEMEALELKFKESLEEEQKYIEERGTMYFCTVKIKVEKIGRKWAQGVIDKKYSNKHIEINEHLTKEFLKENIGKEIVVPVGVCKEYNSYFKNDEYYYYPCKPLINSEIVEEKIGTIDIKGYETCLNSLHKYTLPRAQEGEYYISSYVRDKIKELDGELKENLMEHIRSYRKLAKENYIKVVRKNMEKWSIPSSLEGKLYIHPSCKDIEDKLPEEYMEEYKEFIKQIKENIKNYNLQKEAAKKEEEKNIYTHISPFMSYPREPKFKKGEIFVFKNFEKYGEIISSSYVKDEEVADSICGGYSSVPFVEYTKIRIFSDDENKKYIEKNYQELLEKEQKKALEIDKDLVIVRRRKYIEKIYEENFNRDLQIDVKNVEINFEVTEFGNEIIGRHKQYILEGECIKNPLKLGEYDTEEYLLLDKFKKYFWVFRHLNTFDYDCGMYENVKFNKSNYYAYCIPFTQERERAFREIENVDMNDNKLYPIVK